MKTLKKSIIVKFIVSLSLFAFLLGLLYSIALKPDLSQYLKSFIESIGNVHINTILSNIGIICLIFILSHSMIGLPIPILYLFIETFSIGYTFGIFIVTYKLKGLLFYLIYFLLVKSVFLVLVILFIIVCTRSTLKIIASFKEKNKDQLYKTIKYSFIRLVLVLSISLINSTIIYFIGNKLVNLIVKWVL